MSSRDGVPRADIDTGLFDDVKVRRLAPRQRDGARTLATMSLYVATVLDSWADDRPVTAVDAAPAWMLDTVDDMVADLVAVGLFDDDGCVPVDTLDRWMAGVRNRVAAGARGAAKRWSGDAPPLGDHEGPNAVPKPTPTVPTVPTVPSARARARGKGQGPNDGARSLKTILRDMGAEPDLGPKP